MTPPRLIGLTAWLPLFSTLLSMNATAQSPAPAATPAVAAPTSDAPAAGLPMAEIEKLVAPIALYPDVLVSQILPAATFPTDIVMAARWVAEHPDLKDVDKQEWDLSVISVVRYPTVLRMMNTDLDWTNALGAAFMDHPGDVMTAIQNLRHQAAAANVLQTTPQQTVVIEQETIRIVPTEKEVIYVPQYNPQVIYVDDDDDDDDGVSVAGAITASAISFGAGLAMGAWLDNDCDWHGGVVVGCRPGYWGGYGWHGAVSWDNDWVAARGPRRGVVAGENGGAYVGPRGAAVWGDNGHGAAWSRGTNRAAPVYGGRYSGYNNVSGNRRNVAAGNSINVNQNNVNIDRGDRTNVRGGDRNSVQGGNRANVGNTANAGNRTNAAGGNRTNAAGGNRANNTAQNRNSSLNTRNNASSVNQQRDRGQQSRNPSASQGGANRNNRPQAQPTQRQPQARPSQGQRSQPQGQRSQAQRSQPQRNSSSAYSGQKRSGGNVQRQSSRGSSSRSGGGSRGGGRGGGRRG